MRLRKGRRLVLSVLSFTACSAPSGGADAGHDTGGLDAGRDAGADAGYDAGVADAGCICRRADGGCPIPPDFPKDASVSAREELCFCEPNPSYFCADETPVRCSNSWLCYPRKADDGGVAYDDGGLPDCYC